MMVHPAAGRSAVPKRPYPVWARYRRHEGSEG